MGLLHSQRLLLLQMMSLTLAQHWLSPGVETPPTNATANLRFTKEVAFTGRGLITDGYYPRKVT